MADPTLEEIRDLLVKHVATSNARADDLSTRMTARDTADAEFRGEMRGALKAVQGQHAELRKDFDASREDIVKGRKAYDSVHELADGLDKVQIAVHDTIAPKLDALGKHLEKQDLEAEQRERQKIEARQQESIAAKKLEENKQAERADAEKRRDYRLKVLTIVCGLAGLVLPAAVAGYFSLQASKMHEESQRQAIESQRQFSVLSQQLQQHPTYGSPTYLPAPPATGTAYALPTAAPAAAPLSK